MEQSLDEIEANGSTATSLNFEKLKAQPATTKHKRISSATQ